MHATEHFDPAAGRHLLLTVVDSSMVPGKLPSQLEILSTGQNYYESAATASA